jgi:hypothetical protein
VTALVLVFAFTAGGVILLAREYDDRIADRSIAQSIAFQAARAGAQQISLDALRADGVVRLDVDRARAEADAAARRLLADAAKDGSALVVVSDDTVTVTITLVDVVEGGFPGSETAEVVARGSARAESG